MGITHEGCFCTFFRDTTRAPATPKMELLVTLLNGFHLLTNVTKNFILDIVKVLKPSLLLYIEVLLKKIGT